MTALGTITSEAGFRYDLTADDLQWLARAVKYEGGNELATMWALAQRFVEVREGGSSAYPSFKSLIRKYAQPVNPIWMRDGSMCRPGGNWYDRCRGDYCPCEERRLAVRDRAAVDPAEEQLALARRWAAGEFPNPVPRAVHYAAPFVVRPQLESGELTSLVLGDDNDNWYATDATSQRWSKDHVRVSGTGAGGFPLGAAVGLGLGGVIVLGLAWWAVQRSA